MFKRFHLLLTFLLSLVLLTACSGDGDNYDPIDPGPYGQFMDSAVQGLYYEASPSGKSGTTNKDGLFYYESGDTLSFYIGDISLGSATAAKFITPVHLVEGAQDETHPIVKNIASLLQSLDADSDPENGIVIPASVSEAAAGKSIIFDNANFISDATTLLSEIFTIVGTAAPMLVLPDDAANHLHATLKVLNAGIFGGTWEQTAGEGIVNGTWQFAVDIDGNLFGCVSFDTFDSIVTGSVDSKGTATFANTGMSFTGDINYERSVSGTWETVDLNASGEFVGSLLPLDDFTCDELSNPDQSNPDQNTGGTGGPAKTNLGLLDIAGIDTETTTTVFEPTSMDIIASSAQQTDYLWGSESFTGSAEVSYLGLVVNNVDSSLEAIYYSYMPSIGSNIVYSYALSPVPDSVVFDLTSQTVTLTNVAFLPMIGSNDKSTSTITFNGTLLINLSAGGSATP